MSLSGQQRKKIQEALINAFPNMASLEQMLSFGLNKNLREIAPERSLQKIVFDLIRAAESQGWVEDLIRAAYNSNPGNEKLRAIAEGLPNRAPEITPNTSQEQNDGALRQNLSNNGSGATFKRPEVRRNDLRRNYELLVTHNFDLQILTEECLKKVLPRNGLIGIAVPYDKGSFPRNFCDRLKDDLGKSNIKIKFIKLDWKLNSVGTAVKKIEESRDSLHQSDVIFMILVSDNLCNSNSSIIETFEQKMNSQFYENYIHRLILIMFGNRDSVFPQNFTRLNPPQFESVHVHKWVCEVRRAKGWTEEVQEKLKQKMIKCCLSQNENEGELLDIEYVYFYLDKCICILKQEDCSAEDLLNALD